VHCRVYLDGGERDIEFVGGEAVGLDVGDAYFVGGGGGVVDYADGEQDVCCYSCGENGLEGVVDVLADYVDSAWGARHELRCVAVICFELGEESLPSCCLGGEGISGVYILEGLYDWDCSCHCVVGWGCFLCFCGGFEGGCSRG